MDEEFQKMLIEFSKDFFEKEKSWIEKNIKGKSLDDAIWDNFKGLTIELMRLKCRYMFFYDGLVDLKEEKHSKKEKDFLEDMIYYINLVVENFEDCLKPIVDVSS